MTAARDVTAVRSNPNAHTEFCMDLCIGDKAVDNVPARNIELACAHPEGLATLHRGEESAWCPVCEADVTVRKIELPE